MSSSNPQIDLTLPDKHNRLILEEAAKSSTPQKLQSLLDQASTLKGSEQLVCESAAASGNVSVFRSVLERDPTKIDVLSQTLRLNAITGGVEIWKVLLAYDREVIQWGFGHRADLIGMVVNGGDVALLAFLLSEGADVEQSHFAYKPVLKFAKDEEASQEVVDLLVKYGATMKSSV